MSEKKQEWGMVNMRLTEDVHGMLLYLKRQYKTNISDAVREFMKEQHPEIVKEGERIATKRRQYRDAATGEDEADE